MSMGFPGGASGKEPTRQCWRRKKHWFDSWVREDALEEGAAAHTSIVAWRIPWTEEPGGLQSMGSQSRTRLKRLSLSLGSTGRKCFCQIPLNISEHIF